MCGILGKVTFTNIHESPEVFDNALHQIDHRGPDSRGTYHSIIPYKYQLSLGHTRLSILDLSHAGHQPMVSPRTGSIIVYNGEVYNFLDIRSELENREYTFNSECDTEVILAAYDEWSESFVGKFIGMFAIALWDFKRHKIILVRDRLGIKPLYYYWDGKQFAFSSEITALSALPTLCLDVSQEAVHQLLLYGYIPCPLSIFQNVKKLLPGNILVLDLLNHQFQQYSYWEPLNYYTDSKQFKSEDDVIEVLRVELSKAVRRRLISDVPVGAFLSGGIDSSLVVALMQQASSTTVNTFSIGFSETRWNEAPAAKRIADYLGTNHEEFYITEENILDIAQNAAKYYDEPFADSSSIPTLALCRMTREHITVALSGDGGDELFWGYNRYVPSHFIPFDKYKIIPRFLRQCIGKPMQMIKGGRFEAWGQLLCFKDLIDYYLGSFLLNLKLYPRLHIHPVETNQVLEMYRQVALQLKGLNRDVLTGAMDLHSYLPDDILTKVDRASMSVGLEVRVPILDHNVVQLAAGIPSSFKTAHGESKYLLKRLLSEYLPRELWDRPKKGFGVPISLWLRTSLKDWAYEELLSTQHHLHDWLDKNELKNILDTHIAGKRKLDDLIWSCLQLAGWDRRITKIRTESIKLISQNKTL